MLESIVNDFSDLLNWINSKYSNRIMITGEFASFWSSIIINNINELVELAPTKRISNQLYLYLKPNLRTVWYSLRFADPAPDQIMKFSRERQLKLLSQSLISKFLYCYIKENGLEYNYTNARKLFNEWFDELKNDTIVRIEWFPVLNIKIQSEHLKLTEEISLRKLSESDTRTLENHVTDFSPLLIFTHFQEGIVIEGKFTENIQSRKPINYNSYLSRILTIFRLIQTNWIFLGNLIFYKETLGICKNFQVTYSSGQFDRFQVTT